MTAPYYTDDQVTLFGGDALAVLAGLPDASVDAVVTDPPYSSGGMVRGDRTPPTRRKYVNSEQVARATGGGALDDFTGDSRDQRGYAYWSALWLGQARRVTRPGGVIVAFTDWRQLPVTTDVLQAGGWVWRGIVPWAKPDARPQIGRFTAACEYVVWGSNGAMPTEGAALPGFYQARAPRDREHITQKPLDVMRSLLQITPMNGTVLDPFMGSGTTGIAAVAESRRFIGVEMVPHYLQVAERRIRTALGEAIDHGDQPTLDLSEGATA